MRQRFAWRHHHIELLEPRLMLDGNTLATATPITFFQNPGQIDTANVDGYLPDFDSVALYGVQLNAGDVLTAEVEAQSIGSEFDSLLRVFNSSGQQLAVNNNHFGRDPALSLQVPTAGTYYVGISAYDNSSYDPVNGTNETGDESDGMYDLELSRTNAPLQPDLVGTSLTTYAPHAGDFTDQLIAVWGQTLTVNYTVSNWGGADAGSFAIDFRFANTDAFDDSSLLLASAQINDLAVGASTSGSLTVTLPASPPGGFSPTGTNWLGMVIDPDDSLPESIGPDNAGGRLGTNSDELDMISLLPGIQAGSSTASAPTIGLNAEISGQLSSGASQFYAIQVAQPGGLLLQLYPATLNARLSLLNAEGVPILQSDAGGPANQMASIDQYFSAAAAEGTYFIEVQSLAGPESPYTLFGLFDADDSPYNTMPLPGPSIAMVSADFNGDSNPDLAIAGEQSPNVTVLINNGSGTFQPPISVPLGTGLQVVAGLVVGDFNGDGIPDLAAVIDDPSDPADGTVAVALGLGNGQFAPAQDFGTFYNPTAIAVGDFNGDGQLDLAVAENNANPSASSDVAILYGNGHGSFAENTDPSAGMPVRYSLGGQDPIQLVAGDFLNNGYLDIAALNSASSDISVLYGQAAGSLGNLTVLTPLDSDVTPGEQSGCPLGSLESLVVAGFEDQGGNGYPDLAVVSSNNEGTYDLVVFGGSATGFSNNWVIDTEDVADNASQLAVGDFDNDGYWDLAVAHSVGNSDDKPFVEVLLNDEEGPLGLAFGGYLFDDAQQFGVSSDSQLVLPVDLSDNYVDLAVAVTTADGSSGGLDVLQGKGDADFTQVGDENFAGDGPTNVVVADFNGDGVADMATVNPYDVGVSVFLGQSNGAFGLSQNYYVATTDDYSTTNWIAAGDFNGDGRTDIAVAISNWDGQYTEGQISILDGLGDGTFTQQSDDQGNPIYFDSGGQNPVEIVAGHFFGTSNLDLAILNQGDGTDSNILDTNLTLLQNLGDGNFAPPLRFAVGADPTGLAVGDFNGDGTPDLAVVHDNNQLTLLLSAPGGQFYESSVTLTGPTGGSMPPIVAIAAGRFDASGHEDLAIADAASNLYLLDGNGLGGFVEQPAAALPVAGQVTSLAAGHFENTLVDDLAVGIDPGSTPGVVPGEVVVLRPQSGGQVALASTFQTGRAPESIVAADLNGDGLDDLAIVSQLDDDVLAEASLGNGTFAPLTSVAQQIMSPLEADLNGDGAPDSIVLTTAGTIIYRQAHSGQSDSFAPPETVNADVQARDIAIVTTNKGPAIAALGYDGSLRLYRLLPDGVFSSTVVDPDVGSLPVSLAVGDLNGDGLEDIVVLNAGSSDVAIFDQQTGGDFPLAQTIGLSGTPDVVQLAPSVKNGPLNIIIGDKFDNTITVVPNLGNGTFSNSLADQLHFATLGDYGVGALDGSPQLVEPLGTTQIVVADMNNDGIPDLVVLSQGSGVVSVLLADGLGGYRDPIGVVGFPSPTAVAVADFNGDGNADIAVLEDNYVSLLTGNGLGGFAEGSFSEVVDGSLGLSAFPTSRTVNGRPVYNISVDDPQGDLLTLDGDGQGNFQPYQFADQHVALAVTNLTGQPGEEDFIYANQSLSQVYVQFGDSGSDAQLPAGQTPLLLPGAVKVADVDGVTYLVVANTGANDVLVYRQGADGTFTLTQTVPVGTQPTGITVTGLQPDGTVIPNLFGDDTAAAIPDVVVADEGSDDVAVLLGSGSGSDWTLTAGPRLKVGSGPVAVTVADVTGPAGKPDGIPDLVVTNRGSDTVSVLQGLGDGFFNDLAPLTFPTGADPLASIVGNFDGHTDLVTVNAGSNNLTFYSNFIQAGPDADALSISTGGLTPVAAIEGNFLFTGFDDLIVANNGSNSYRLLVGGLGGLSLSSMQAAGQDPSDLAAVFDPTASDYQVFGVGQGANAASLLFVFGPTASEPSTTEPEVQVSLLPLVSSTLAVVATLVAAPDSDLALESTSGLRTTTPVAVSAVAVTSLGFNALETEDAGGGELAGELVESNSPHGAPTPSPGEIKLFNFLLEIEEMLEQNHRELLDQLLGASAVPVFQWLRAIARPEDRALEPAGDGRPGGFEHPAPQHSTPAETSPALDDRVVAIDAAMNALAERDASGRWQPPEHDSDARSERAKLHAGEFEFMPVLLGTAASSLPARSPARRSARRRKK